MSDSAQNWERDMLERIALEGYREQRRARRWGVFFKLLVAVYVLGIFVAPNTYFWMKGNEERPAHVAVVEINGQIAPGAPASAESINKRLRSAFRAEESVAVMLRINSPGGSPVQAGMVYDEINRLKGLYPEKPVYAVALDTMASGAYYIAAGADEIYANKASMVGSIGVIMQSFGFDEFIEDLGIERRLYTAGKNKAFMDPFAPEDQGAIEHVDGLLGEIHSQFKTVVLEGRSGKVDPADETLFSGLMWTGSQSVEKGLVDGLASPLGVAREEVGVEKLITYQDGPSFNIMDYLVSAVAGEIVARGEQAIESASSAKPHLDLAPPSR
jgi:protease-4